METGPLVALILTGLMIYIVLSSILYSNIKLGDPYRGIFSFTFLPIFVVLMVVNMAIVVKLFPFIVNLATSTTDRPSVFRIRKELDPQDYGRILMTTPLAAFGTFLWFRYFKRLERKKKQRLAPPKSNRFARG